jgi:hypothetical protein
MTNLFVNVSQNDLLSPSSNHSRTGGERCSREKFMRIALRNALALLLCFGATPMQAAEIMREPSVGVRLGVLTCRLAGGPGFVVVSSQPAQCEFRASNGEIDHYQGLINRFGVDLGYTDGAVLSWVVLSVGSNSPGNLAGFYGGASANLALAVGGGANALVGGLAHSLVLQPVSFQTQTGINVAVTLTGLSLN